jgi:hypothetical protein
MPLPRVAGSLRSGRSRSGVDQLLDGAGRGTAGHDDRAQQRFVAAILASVHRVLYAEASQRSLAGEPRAEICAVLARAATRAFDLIEPSVGSYGIRAPAGAR